MQNVQPRPSLRHTKYNFSDTLFANQKRYRKMSRFKTIAITLLGATVLSICLYWWQLLSSTSELRDKTLSQAMQTATRLAVAGAGQTEALIRNMDATLEDLRHDYIFQPSEFDEAVKRALRAQPDGLILQVGIIDQAGLLAYSSLGTPSNVYLGDREHFRIHQQPGYGDRLFVSAPLFGRRSSNWTIQLTRRIESKGQFKGVVVISISPEYLARQLARFNLGSGDTIAIFRADGTYLSRTPNLGEYMGKTVRADRPFLGEKAPANGAFRALSTYDSVQRSFAWERVAHYPMIVTAGIAEPDYLATIDQEISAGQLRNGLGTALIMLLAGTLAALILRLEKEQASALNSATLYRHLFENNTSIKLIIDLANGQIVDANPAACRFYGYPREQFQHLQLSDINPLSPDEIAGEVALAKREQRQYFNFPNRMANGEIRQVEVYSGPVEQDGRILQYSIIHDVTHRRQLEAQLEASEARLRSIFAALPDGVLIVAEDGRITQWNEAALNVLDVDEKMLLERRHAIHYADGRPVPLEDFPSLRAIRRDPVFNSELYAIVRDNKPRRWVSISARPLPPDEKGQSAGEVIALVDVSRVIELEASHQIAQSVFESTTEGIVVCDGENRIVSVNPAFTSITGYPAEEALGRDPGFLSSGHHDSRFYGEMYKLLNQHDCWEGEITNRRRDGSIYVAWLKIAIIREADGRIRRYVALFSDITIKKKQQQEVWHQANYDALTDLPNRVLLNDRLQQAITQAARREGMAAVLYIDLDRFKPVNDRYGHPAGDELLRQVARRIGNCIREEDTVARIGGDEFLVLLPMLTQREAALKIAEKIIGSLDQPFRLAPATVDISASIGIALYPEHGQSAGLLLEHGDTAMYQAKSEGRHTVRLYSPPATPPAAC